MAALSAKEKEMYDRYRRINGAVARAERTVSGARCWRCDGRLYAGRGVLVRLDGLHEAVVHVECARALLGSPAANGLKNVMVTIHTFEPSSGRPRPAGFFISSVSGEVVTRYTTNT